MPRAAYTYTLQVSFEVEGDGPDVDKVQNLVEDALQCALESDLNDYQAQGLDKLSSPVVVVLK